MRKRTGTGAIARGATGPPPARPAARAARAAPTPLLALALAHALAHARARALHAAPLVVSTLTLASVLPPSSPLTLSLSLCAPLMTQ